MRKIRIRQFAVLCAGCLAVAVFMTGCGFLQNIMSGGQGQLEDSAQEEAGVSASVDSGFRGQTDNSDGIFRFAQVVEHDKVWYWSAHPGETYDYDYETPGGVGMFHFNVENQMINDQEKVMQYFNDIDANYVSDVRMAYTDNFLYVLTYNGEKLKFYQYTPDGKLVGQVAETIWKEDWVSEYIAYFYKGCIYYPSDGGKLMCTQVDSGETRQIADLGTESGWTAGCYTIASDGKIYLNYYYRDSEKDITISEFHAISTEDGTVQTFAFPDYLQSGDFNRVKVVTGTDIMLFMGGRTCAYHINDGTIDEISFSPYGSVGNLVFAGRLFYNLDTKEEMEMENLTGDYLAYVANWDVANATQVMAVTQDETGTCFVPAEEVEAEFYK